MRLVDRDTTPLTFQLAFRATYEELVEAMGDEPNGPNPAYRSGTSWIIDLGGRTASIRTWRDPDLVPWSDTIWWHVEADSTSTTNELMNELETRLGRKLRRDET